MFCSNPRNVLNNTFNQLPFSGKGKTIMQGRDGTGPMGLGPMMGRGSGYCGGRNAAQGASRGLGLGFRGSRGAGRGGRGRRNMFYATGLTGWQRAAMAASPATAETASPAMDVGKQTLETKIEAMQSQLDAMKRRLAEMDQQQT
jgi:hypothetical protein